MWVQVTQAAGSAFLHLDSVSRAGGRDPGPSRSARWNGRARQPLIGPRWFEWGDFHLTWLTRARSGEAWASGAGRTATSH